MKAIVTRVPDDVWQDLRDYVASRKAKSIHHVTIQEVTAEAIIAHLKKHKKGGKK